MPLFNTSVVSIRGSWETDNACNPPQLWPPTAIRVTSMRRWNAPPSRAVSRSAHSMASIIWLAWVASVEPSVGAGAPPPATPSETMT
jgi:hypothetical protein